MPPTLTLAATQRGEILGTAAYNEQQDFPTLRQTPETLAAKKALDRRSGYVHSLSDLPRHQNTATQPHDAAACAPTTRIPSSEPTAHGLSASAWR